jgi:hypothetical protein
MKATRSIYLFILLFFVMALSSCATHTQTNQLIADANAARYKVYVDGMVAAKGDAVAQMGITTAFFAGVGQQPYYREDSPLDYVKASGFILGPVVDVLRLYHTYSGGSGNGGVNVIGDNNQLIGWNRLTADNQSTLTGTLDTTSSIEHLVYTQDGTKSSSNGTGSVENVENPVTTDDHSTVPAP